MKQRPNSVFDTLSGGAHARLETHMNLGNGQSLAIWSNRDSRVRYENAALNTISLYLEGGEEVMRNDGGTVRLGQPDSICLMPTGIDTEWHIGTPFRFIHLYLPDEGLRHILVETFDRDPQMLALPDLAFAQDPVLRNQMTALAGAALSGQLLHAHEIVAGIEHHILSAPGYLSARPLKAQGGLGAGRTRRLRDYMKAHLDRQITLDDLAQQAGLSRFHLQRMFRRSFGMTPHDWLTRKRIAKAETMLRAGADVASTALACGFCHQSHLTRAFRNARGITPARFARTQVPA